MTEAIIVALITGFCAVVSQIILSARANRELYAKLDKQSEVADAKIRGEIDVINEEISGLRAEVQKHNQLVERTYKIEERLSVTEEKVKVANNRIADLEAEAHRG